ncbi:hypothetical protein BAE44_0002512 [Dichanthelium oligosanthes]|uniref:Uncharacterized protein n=1 Tax=Dichanthelium oligosanthes TaxID=888268 RepID=A0A1E5WGE7_9POAL|nr:hypothetical protein BAE44_0002512 [Dichanthelium oligosanthes]
MAAGESSAPSTSFFKIRKDGALLPARNRSLFSAVFALAVAYTSLLVVVNDLAVQPRVDKVLLDVMAFNNGTATDPRSPDDNAQLLQDFGEDTWRLVRAGAAYLLLDATVGSAVWIIALFAAVATYSGETHSLGSLLGKARAQVKGPALTVAFVYVLQIAYAVVLLAAMAALLARLLAKGRTGLLLLGWLLLLAAAAFLVYFTFLCALSVVVATAEPGCHGADAVGRAWRMLRGRRKRAVLFVAVFGALAIAGSRVHALARTCSLASGLVLGSLYAVVMAAVELFAACAITAFYYECKEGNDDAATTEFAKLASEELIGARRVKGP